MDFSWSEEQLAYKKAVIEFAQKELQADLIELDRQSEFLARKAGKNALTSVSRGFHFPKSMAVLMLTS